MASTERLPSSGRVEAFSDGVFAIAITLLVLDLRVPEHEPGELLPSLGSIWPSYLAYIAAFLSIGVVWLNHHAVFSRVQSVDRGVLGTNLLLLLLTSVLPFPTSVLADAIRAGSLVDQRVAIGLYGLVSAATTVPWLLLYHHLHATPELARDGTRPGYFGAQRTRAVAGMVGFLLAIVLGVTLSPLVGLALFVALPLFYAITSEGALPRASTPAK
ncbi:TMEM175 family protein [Amnibacterium kyonggiense]|nr:TMEM175 family protein [Amnibacterium kyonggiense]